MRSEARRRHLRSAFGHYLAPTVIEQLLEDPKRLKLGGERRETTFLFTDIAGFTTLSEQTDPEVLVRLLNDYLDGTCRIALEHGGTIDKIVGDALHVMFNAPSDQPDHADRCLRCAIKMQRKMAELNERWAGEGKQAEPFVVRIGLNTGTVVVGNVGGEKPDGPGAERPGNGGADRRG